METGMVNENMNEVLVLKGVEEDMAVKAQELRTRKQKLTEARDAQAAVGQHFGAFEELSAKALDLHAKGFDQEVTGQMVGDVKTRIAGLAGRLYEPELPRQEVAKIRTEMRRLNDNAVNFVTGQQRMQEFLGSMQQVDVVDGWDSVLSAGVQVEVGRAILSAAEKGMKENAEGSFDVGEFMRYRLDEEGNPVLMMQDGQGEWKTGTIDETLNRWRSQMTPYVDLETGLWAHAGEGVEAQARVYYQEKPGGLAEALRLGDWTEVDRMTEADFDGRFPDTEHFKDLPKEVRKAVLSGREAGWQSREDVRQAYVERGRGRVRRELAAYLEQNPEELDSYRKWRGQDVAQPAGYQEKLNRAIADFARQTPEGKMPDGQFKQALKGIEAVVGENGYGVKEKGGNGWWVWNRKNLRLVLEDLSGQRADVVVEGNNREAFLQDLKGKLQGLDATVKGGLPDLSGF